MTVRYPRPVERFLPGFHADFVGRKPQRAFREAVLVTKVDDLGRQLRSAGVSHSAYRVLAPLLDPRVHIIPTSGEGASGTNYDQSSFRDETNGWRWFV